MIKTILYGILIFLGIWLIVPWLIILFDMYIGWVAEIKDIIEDYFIQKHNERVTKKWKE